MNERVGIVIVHWKNWNLTRACVDSVERQTWKNIFLEIVDNDARNLGFAGGANVGIRAILGDERVEWILVLNNDVRLEPRAMREMVETAKREKADMVSPTVLTADGARVDRLGIVMNRSLLGFDAKQDSEEIFAPSGCAALYSRRLLEDVMIEEEYFDEDFFLYAEDSDLGWRARLLGYTCALAKDAIVYHEGSASQESGSLDPIYYGHRNNLLSIVKNTTPQLWARQGVWIVVGQLASVLVVSAQGHPLLILKAKVEAMRTLPAAVRKRKQIQAKVRSAGRSRSLT